MKNTLKRWAKNFGWTVLWFAWLYPLMRTFMIIPMMIAQQNLPYTTFTKWAHYATIFHGGKPMYEFLSFRYLVFFSLSVVAYLFWHYRTKTRIRWGARIILPLVILFNFALPHMIRASLAELEARAQEPQERPPIDNSQEEGEADEPAKRLFLEGSF